jgi:hypothetical protein
VHHEVQISRELTISEQNMRTQPRTSQSIENPPSGKTKNQAFIFVQVEPLFRFRNRDRLEVPFSLYVACTAIVDFANKTILLVVGAVRAPSPACAVFSWRESSSIIGELHKLVVSETGRKQRRFERSRLHRLNCQNAFPPSGCALLKIVRAADQAAVLHSPFDACDFHSLAWEWSLANRDAAAAKSRVHKRALQEV